MNEWMNERTNEQMNEWMNEYRTSSSCDCMLQSETTPAGKFAGLVLLLIDFDFICINVIQEKTSVILSRVCGTNTLVKYR